MTLPGKAAGLKALSRPPGSVQPLLELLAFPHDRPPSQSLQEMGVEDWTAVLQCARDKRISPYLYPRLRWLGPLVPESVLKAFRLDYKANALRNLELLAQLHALVSALNATGIPVLLLKGAHLAFGVYRDSSTRVIGDLDVLVPRSKLTESADVLRELGYQSNCLLQIEEQIQLSHHLAPLSLAGRAPVELHWTIGPPGQRISPDSEELWSRTQEFRAGPISLRALSNENLLLHLCIHTAFQHRFRVGLRAFADIAELLAATNSSFNWDLFQRLSIPERRRGIYLTLSLAVEIAGAGVPKTAWTGLGGGEPCDTAKEAALGLILCESGSLRVVPERLANAWEEPSVRGRLRSFLEGVFVSRVRLARQYGVRPDSAKIPLFYLYRLFRVLRLYGSAALGLYRREPNLSEIVRWNGCVSQWLEGEPDKNG